MSLRFLFLYTLALLPGWRTYAQDTTATRRPEYPMFQETPLFVGGQDNINTYRIPSLICTEKGTVLAFAEGRINSYDDGSPTDLVMKRSPGNTWSMVPPSREDPRISETRSREKNMTWLPMRTLVKSKNGDAYMNPVPVIDATTGTIYLLVNRYPRYGEAENLGGGVTEIWLMKSGDEGLTWSKPVNITAGLRNTALGPGIGIQMKSGRLVAPIYDGAIFSDDHGKTWKAGNKTPALVNECQLVELADGSLMLNTRGYPFRTVSISHDGGETWGEVHRDTSLTDPKLWGGCQASLIRYTRKDEGFARNRILFSNPADSLYRFDLTVRMSYDEGRTWPFSRVIRKGQGAYSCMTVFPDGSIGIIYETNNCNTGAVDYYANLSFARFNLEWLTGGRDWLVK